MLDIIITAVVVISLEDLGTGCQGSICLKDREAPWEGTYPEER